jgi:hypothetical protein
MPIQPLVTFDYQRTGDTQPEPYLEEDEIENLFEQTRADLGSAIARKLAGVVCADHQQAAAVRVNLLYDRQTEQMDVSYSVEPCCQLFLQRVVQLLHRVG